MPIYEYICDHCGGEFEKMVRFSEADQAPECPKCASQDTHKKISKVGILGGALSGSLGSTSSGCGSHGGFS